MTSVLGIQAVLRGFVQEGLTRFSYELLESRRKFSHHTLVSTAAEHRLCHLSVKEQNIPLGKGSRRRLMSLLEIEVCTPGYLFNHGA